MEFELQAKLNDGIVTLVYMVEKDAVDCYDNGVEYEKEVLSYSLERVIYKGLDISETVSYEQWMDLEMECQHEHEANRELLNNSFPDLAEAATGLMSLSIRRAA